MEEMISVNNLRKEFSYYKKGAGLQGSLNNLFHRQMLTKEAVKDVSFSVGKGEMMALLGPNGAGKTTTLKLLSGILYPTSGEVLVNGFVPWERKNEFKRSFAIVMGQKNQLWWDLPASDSLYLNKCIYDVDDREYKKTVDELSELLGVRELMNIQVRRLSLGERMKMEILAALIHRPGILFLDEPTIGLDIVSQQKIRDFLHYYNEQTKTTIILTSHYMRDIEALCSRAVIIISGTLVYDGALSDINHAVYRQHHVHRVVGGVGVEPLPVAGDLVLGVALGVLLVQCGLRLKIAHPEPPSPVLEPMPQHRKQPVRIAGIVKGRAELPHRVYRVLLFKKCPLVGLGLLHKADQGIHKQSQLGVVAIPIAGVAPGRGEQRRRNVRFKLLFGGVEGHG